MLPASFPIAYSTRYIGGIGLLTASLNLVVAYKNSLGCNVSTSNDESCGLCFRIFFRLEENFSHTSKSLMRTNLIFVQKNVPMRKFELFLCEI